MNRKLNFFPLFFLSVITLFVACNGGDNVDPPEYGRSNLHLSNVSETGGTFDLQFDYFNATSLAITSMEYQRNWPVEGYADLEEGGTPADDGSGKLYMRGLTQVALGGTPDTIFGPKAIRLIKDDLATMCLYDSSGAVASIKFADAFLTPSDTDSIAVVRFINLKEGLPASGFRISGGAFDISNISWRTASDFRNWTAGSYTVEAYDASTGTIVVSTSMDLDPGKVYTILLSGTSGTDLTWFKH